MNEIISVTIETLGAQGDGIGSYNGLPVYVPFALPGDQIAAEIIDQKRGGITARIDTVVVASADRRNPLCQHFGACGGCKLQHFSEALYMRWTKERLHMALSQHGFSDVPITEPVITAQSSRRRVALKALKVIGGVIIGFNERNTHRIIDIKMCNVTRPAILTLLPDLRAVLNGLLPQKGLATLHITETVVGLDVLIETSLSLDLAARETLLAFAEKHDLASLHWQDAGFLDPIAIRREPVMVFGGVRVPLPPATFIQATQQGEDTLVKAATHACAGMGRVADLFCGLGTFTFPLAQDHQVLAVEGARGALDGLEAARSNAMRSGQKLKQIVTKHRDLFRRPLTAAELNGFDAVVIDPPRAGALEQMRNLAASEVKRIVAVSCNPNTFARDARVLADGGYTLESVLPIDQFLWSPHLELVSVFSR